MLKSCNKCKTGPNRENKQKPKGDNNNDVVKTSKTTNSSERHLALTYPCTSKGRGTLTFTDSSPLTNSQSTRNESKRCINEESYLNALSNGPSKLKVSAPQQMPSYLLTNLV